jgi:hypothetical protein
MDAGVDQLVVKDEIAALGEGGEQCRVGGIAAGKEKRGARTEMRGGFGLQCLMLGMIAAQEARAARADRHAAIERGAGGVPQFRGFGQSEIVVRGEIDARAGNERAAAMLRVERGQAAAVEVEDRLGGCLAGVRREGEV